MSDEATLVELLRSSALTNGSINLRRIHGSGWSAVIAHNRFGEEHPYDHMVHPFDQQWHDPVEALRVALIEDERRCRDLERRYAAAPKMTPKEQRHERRVEEHTLIDSDFEDLLG